MVKLTVGVEGMACGRGLCRVAFRCSTDYFSSGFRGSTPAIPPELCGGCDGLCSGGGTDTGDVGRETL